MKYEDIASAQDLQDDIEEIKKGHDVWLAEREGRTPTDSAGPHKGGQKAGESKAGDATAVQAIDTDDAVAKETRCAHVSLIVMPETALACASSVRSAPCYHCPPQRCNSLSMHIFCHYVYSSTCSSPP